MIGTTHGRGFIGRCRGQAVGLCWRNSCDNSSKAWQQFTNVLAFGHSWSGIRTRYSRSRWRLGLCGLEIYRLFATSRFFARLSLLLAMMSFVPSGLVLLVHMREAGPLMWWDNSNVVLTTRRSRKLEK